MNQWKDDNGRLWDTVADRPIPLGHDREEVDHEHAGRLTTPEAAEKFILAGNATITIVSLKTEKRYTFKIRKPEDFNPDRPIWFVSVLKGSDNESDYGYVGQITLRGGEWLYARGKKCWEAWHAASDAFAWVWHQIITDGDKFERVEVWHEGRCGRCGRKLTVPESVESGFGPECINYL